MCQKTKKQTKNILQHLSSRVVLLNATNIKRITESKGSITGQTFYIQLQIVSEKLDTL